jgi:hypothetical protein
MAVFETYSKRQKRLSGDVDVFQYENVPKKLRVQIAHIIHDVLGSEDQAADGRPYSIYHHLVNQFRREDGVFCLVPNMAGYVSAFEELTEYVTTYSSNEQCLDAVEIIFRVIDRGTRNFDYLQRLEANAIADGAISDLNTRFMENGLGFQYVSGELLRTDSQLLHHEAVKPALALLNTKEYQGPQEEFLSAYEHYKAGKNKEALSDANKAFESTMKAICDKRGWAYDSTKDTAKKLIEIMFANGLVPQFWQQQFNSLRSLLESSIPTGRNKLSGHGQGATPTEVPDYLTAYMLHMTASTLVFLTTAEMELP